MTSSYVNSFFAPQIKDEGRHIAVSTARAGNVIGGGDFASDRIIPDCIRAVEQKKDIIVRNPFSTRPYQHVLEPVMAYLMICQRQYEDISYAGSYNVGPDDTDCYTTGELVSLFCETWKELSGQEIIWIDRYDGGPHEANFLKLNCSKLRNTFDWNPVWNVKEAMKKIVEWELAYQNMNTEEKDACIENIMNEQIESYRASMNDEC